MRCLIKESVGKSTEYLLMSSWLWIVSRSIQYAFVYRVSDVLLTFAQTSSVCLWLAETLGFGCCSDPELLVGNEVVSNVCSL